MSKLFWIAFSINALVSPLMALMGLNAWAFQVKHEFHWAVGYFVGMGAAFGPHRAGKFDLAWIAIAATTLITFYVLSRIL